ncbi:hypothetical protein [Massilia glaciei]|nr:hypothetical protein [Massilia glaciei]
MNNKLIATLAATVALAFPVLAHGQMDRAAPAKSAGMLERAGPSESRKLDGVVKAVNRGTMTIMAGGQEFILPIAKDANPKELVGKKIKVTVTITFKPLKVEISAEF